MLDVAVPLNNRLIPICDITAAAVWTGKSIQLTIFCYFNEILVIISLSILLFQDLNYRPISTADKLLSLSDPLHTTQ
jgi:hypothetical protein